MAFPYQMVNREFNILRMKLKDLFQAIFCSKENVNTFIVCDVHMPSISEAGAL